MFRLLRAIFRLNIRCIHNTIPEGISAPVPTYITAAENSEQRSFIYVIHRTLQKTNFRVYSNKIYHVKLYREIQ